MRHTSHPVKYVTASLNSLFKQFSGRFSHPRRLRIGFQPIPGVVRGPGRVGAAGRERAALELAAARDGVPDYHIRSVGEGGSLPVAPEREEYFPKFYSTEAWTVPVYGLDREQLAAALRQMRFERGLVH
jgi:hypothetical protein